MGLRFEDIPMSPDMKQKALKEYCKQQAARGRPPEMPEGCKASKYHNEKTISGGIHFDSKKEARRYEELMLMLRAGQVRDLKLQETFTLQDAYTSPAGLRVRPIKYVADFTYYEKRFIQCGGYDSTDRSSEEWFFVVEDVKSKATKTKIYEIKKKLLRDKFGIEIREV